ncbi:hypothetical protein Hypma_012167 [Hypsizygus marmoreus]|uniref:Uncharacterized protein n=1 Tax=Hypsizygus marmoreus TaxID=39966 RepID=A0A369JF23_HYPMA|nr:hypothetical protein Hypma_012167 [Hypsizygus marmoreus]
MNPNSTDLPLNEKSEQQALTQPSTDECIGKVDCNHPRRNNTRRKRFHILIATLVGIWITFKLISSQVFYRFGGYQHKSMMVMEWPIPPDVTVDHCTEWDDKAAFRKIRPGAVLHEPYSAFATFELPVSSEKLFLLSRGLSAGAVTIVNGEEEGDTAKVVVVARYRAYDALDWVKVCAIDREEDEHGVGIFATRWARHHRNSVHFDVTVYLPKGKDGAVLNVKNFETDLPLYHHHVGDLGSHVNFDAISLKSENSAIFVESLDATKAYLETENSPIDGSFNVTSSLALHTQNAHIKVRLNLINNPDHDPTEVTVTTSNAPIRAGVNLVSTASDSVGGKFHVAANTANSGIDVRVHEQPVSSAFFLDAHTSLAPAFIELAPAFEGTFQLETSLKRPVLRYDADAKDPAGKGRRRDVQIRMAGAAVRGSASWSGEEGVALGNVNVATSLSAVTLKL